MIKNRLLVITATIFLLFLFTTVAAAKVDATITSFNPASGTYYPGDTVTSSITFSNTGTKICTYLISYSVVDESGKIYTTSPTSVKLARGKSSVQTKSWTVPTDATGNYDVVMSVSDHRSSTQLAYVQKLNAFTVSSIDTIPSENTGQTIIIAEHFDTFDTTKWYKSSHTLGRTTLQPDNVDVSNGNLRIKLPANTLNGGEICSAELYKYGTYSARMKLPNSPSSITSFLLYAGPSLYNEIDIGIYNDPKGDVWFTTYADGKMQHTASMKLGFDPTADFHEYTFDFYPDKLNFYVDGKLMQTWTDGMTTNPMHLLVNAWYPNWLPGTKPTTDQYLLVDWIKNTGVTPSENTEQTFRYVENFDTFDTTKWYKSSHTLERTSFQPANIDIDNGNLRIKLPANTLTGGEICSAELYKYGTYSARMKLPNAPSSITGFFLYAGPNLYNEIDIEIYNKPDGNIMFTTYADGKMQRTATKELGFDPTADFHEYTFDFYPDRLNFYVDGKLMQTWTDGMTTNSMHLLVNAWYPNWLSGTKPTSDQYLLVDWIKY
jgi:beta-glucanase (GH16 family)